MPTSLRQYIEQHVEQLSDEDQTLLEAASVAGSTFTVATAAAGVAQADAALEARYTALARQGRFVRAAGTETWPDGTVTACYQFLHALYHEVVYARVSAGHRVHLHQQIGLRKEAGYGAQAPTIAAELAMHFTRAQDARRAVEYLHHAADTALRRQTYQEAMQHCRTGLTLLATLPDTAKGPAAGAVLAPYPWSGVDRYKRVCGPRSGTNLHPGADTGTASGGYTSALLSIVGAMDVLRNARSVIHGVAARVRTPRSSQADSGPRFIAGGAPRAGGYMLLPGRVRSARNHLARP